MSVKLRNMELAQEGKLAEKMLRMKRRKREAILRALLTLRDWATREGFDLRELLAEQRTK